MNNFNRLSAQEVNDGNKEASEALTGETMQNNRATRRKVESVLNQFEDKGKTLVINSFKISPVNDASSQQRPLFSYKGVEFAFKGRDEQAYCDSNVVTSLKGLLELAFKLSGNAELEELVSEVRDGKYSPKAINLLDQMIVANHVVETGGSYQFRTKPTAYGNALFLLALLGEEEATAIIQDRLTVLKKYDKAQEAKKNQDLTAMKAPEGVDPLNPKELVVVFATRYAPEATAMQDYLVPSTFDATAGKSLRGSVHTTLNHKVSSHAQGSWEDAGYILIAPFEDMLEANGKPTKLNTVDTWWLRNPGEKLRFPNATLVRPSANKIPGLISVTKKEVRFQSSSYNSADLKQIMAMTKADGTIGLFASSVKQALDNAISELMFEGFDVRDVNELFANVLDDRLHGEELLAKLLTCTNSDGATIDELVTNLCDAVGLSTNVKAALIPKLVANWEVEMMGKLSDLATNMAIAELDYKVQAGGSHAWRNDWGVTESTNLLGKQLGIETGSHFGTVNADLETAFDYYQEDIEHGKFDPSDLETYLPELDPKTRRLFYAAGLLR